MIDVRLTLTTADGAVGVGMLRDKGPLVWTWGTQGEDTAHTVSALFEEMHKGAVIDSVEIDGDEWRGMEDTTPAGYGMLDMLEKGMTLSEAIEVLLEYSDLPEKATEEIEQVQTQQKVQFQLDLAIAGLKAIYFMNQNAPAEWTIHDLANGMRNTAETTLIELDVISSK